MSPLHARAATAADKPALSLAPLFVIAGLGGAGGLLLELAWLRAFALLFTQATHATAVLLACFLGGLAAGTAAAPAVARRLPHWPALALFAAAEALGAALGLVSGLALPLASDALALLWVDGGPLASFRILAQVLVGAAFVLPPTFFLGLSFPFLASATTRSGSPRLPERVGILQGINTLGGAAGVVAAGFFLIPLAGLRNTFVLAALLGGVAALLAWLLTRRTAHALPEHRPPGPVTHDHRPDAALLATPIALAGAAVLAQEVVLSRVLVQILGATLSAVATVLAAFLVGLALGNALGARLAARLPTPTAAARGFCVTQGLAALLGLAYPLLLPQVPALALAARRMLGTEASSTAVAVAITCGALLLPLSVCFGAAYPLAVAARRSTDDVARVAWPLAWSTLGSITGSLLAGFLLIPALGLFRSVAAAAALSATATALALPRRARPLAVVLALALPLALGASLDQRAEVPLARAYFSAQTEQALGVHGPRASTNPVVAPLYYAAGPSATVLVEQEGEERSLYLNGKIVASTILIDQKNQALLAHLPMLLQPAARHALVVGLGTGGTLGALLCHGVQSVTCAELSTEVAGAVPFFRPDNLLDLDDPRLTIAFDDARSVLRAAREPFDLITSDPIHPWVAGAASLYTEDYYHLIRSRLASDGVVAQWLPLYEMGSEDIRAVVATFVRVFPGATLWAAHHDVILVARGDGRPATSTLAALREQFRRPAVTRSLTAVSIESVEDLLGHLLAGPEELARFAQGATIIRDDRLVLEATVPRSLFLQTQGPNLAALLALADVPTRLALLQGLLPDAVLLAGCRRAWLETSVRARGEALRWTAAHLQQDADEAVEGWSRALLLAPGLRMGWSSGRFAAVLEQKVADDPTAAGHWLGLAWSRYLHGLDPAGAAEAAQQALALVEPGREGVDPLVASLHVLGARIAAMDRRFDDALDAIRRARSAAACEPEAIRLEVQLRLTTGDIGQARAAWEVLQSIDPDGVVTSALEARLLLAEDHESQALALAQHVRARDPSEDLVDPIFAGSGADGR